MNYLRENAVKERKFEVFSLLFQKNVNIYNEADFIKNPKKVNGENETCLLLAQCNYNF